MMKLIKTAVMVALIVALASWIWKYVESGFNAMDTTNKQIQQEATDAQQRRERAVDSAVGDYR